MLQVLSQQLCPGHHPQPTYLSHHSPWKAKGLSLYWVAAFTYLRVPLASEWAMWTRVILGSLCKGWDRAE